MKYKISNSFLCLVLAGMSVYAESARPGKVAKGIAKPAVERLVNLNPEERRKALQKLPPERRKQLEERLHQYDLLTPAQKARLYGQYQNFSGLSPEQQAHLRKLFQRFNNFPPERQGALRAEVQKMQTLPASDRRARMNSDEFRNLYNQREQALLAELAKAVPSN